MTFLRRIVLMGIASVAAVLLAETALRLLGIRPVGAVHTVTTREFKAVPGLFSPNQSVRISPVGLSPYHVSINSLGFRGSEFSLRKHAGEYRIVVVGDSFTFGEYVSDEQTLPAQLERELAQQCMGVRVINAGLGGTTIIDQIAIASRTLALKPDVILLVFYENDVLDLRQNPNLWEARNRDIRSRFPYSVIYRGARSTAIWTALSHVRGRFQASGQLPNGETDSAGERRRQELDLRARYAELLERFRDSIVTQGVALVTTAFPSHLTLLGNQSWDQLQWFEETVKGLDGPYVDIARSLMSRGGAAESLYLLPKDFHASALGYTAAASRLANDVARMPPLARPCKTGTSQSSLRFFRRAWLQ
jgi:GDSL-like Lipase/Acylhydrolase family